MAQVIAFILTIVLFLGNSEPASISKAFEDEHACRAAQINVLNTALGDAKVAGFIVTDDCVVVHEANKS